MTMQVEQTSTDLFVSESVMVEKKKQTQSIIVVIQIQNVRLHFNKIKSG